jgi:maleate isomerase
MTDRLGWRAKIGVLVPAFNATTQPELESMRVPGVTNHVARIEMPDLKLDSDADQAKVVESMGPDLMPAIRRVMLVKPAAVVFGISIPVFWGGVAGGTALTHRLNEAAGVPCIVTTDAVLAALACFPDRRKVGVMTPYQPIGDAQVRRYLTESGIDVVAMHSLKRPSNLEIAHADAKMLGDGVRALVAQGCDIVLQVGTNLAVADLVAGLEAELGMPIVSVNTALYWHALRKLDIAERKPGFGRLFEEF